MADIEDPVSHSSEAKGKQRDSNDDPLASACDDANISEAIRLPAPKLVSSLYDERVNAKAEPNLQAVQPDPNAPKIVNPLVEFDEYGTELRKDARVWKVYVEEADKYDKELVTGWKERAALFSAISTAFLIESSKKLQEDPADVSAQTLLVISQTLLALTNSTQPPGTPAARTSNAAGFKPTNTAIWINTLWYLSLSLSLATAFIGILAKEWCHSFLTGRTGHPFEQSERRQRKWDMIERWKMPELLTLLPSLIHAALFLFAIGLCIYLWDMHIAVSIPVVCVSAIAFGFYVWSSVSACALDYFPYPTIISRLYHTQWAQRILMAVKARVRVSFSVLTEIASLILGQLVLPVLTKIIFPALHMLLLIPFIPANILPLPILLLDIIPKWITRFEPPPINFTRSLHGVASAKELARILLHGLYSYFIWKPAFLLHTLLESITEKWTMLLSYVYETEPREMLEFARRWLSRVGTRNPEHQSADVTSQALSWLIKNCETPPSVDVALQSIAGANDRISRKPLLECQATLQILRRLASSNLYREPGPRTNAIIALYSRALSFLSTPVDSGPSNKQSRTRSELEVLIWDLQLETEKTIAKVITDGRFQPTQSNLDALQIGNTAASNSLKTLKKDSRDTDVGTSRVLDSIIELLELQLGHRHPLHQAALLSLVHAAVLLSLFAPKYASGSILPVLCTRLIYDRHHSKRESSSHSQLLITNLAIACIFLCDRYAVQDRLSQLDGSSWSEDVLRGLVERHSQDQVELRMMSRFGRQELDVRREACNLESSSSKPPATFANRESRFYTPSLPRLRALNSIYSLTPIGTLNLDDYLHVLGSMCYEQAPFEQSPLWAYCKELMSKCRFPTLYGGLSWLRGEHCVISLLRGVETRDPVRMFLVVGQLWLLYTLYLDPSYDSAYHAAKTASRTRSTVHRTHRRPESLDDLRTREPTESSKSSVSFAEAPPFARLRSRSPSTIRIIHIEPSDYWFSSNSTSPYRSPRTIRVGHDSRSTSGSRNPVQIIPAEYSHHLHSRRSYSPQIIQVHSASSGSSLYRRRSESPARVIQVDAARSRSRSPSPTRIIQAESNPSRNSRSRSRSPHIVHARYVRPVSPHSASRARSESPTRAIQVDAVRSTSRSPSPTRRIQVESSRFSRSRPRHRNPRITQVHSTRPGFSRPRPRSESPTRIIRVGAVRSQSRSPSPNRIVQLESSRSGRSWSRPHNPQIIRARSSSSRPARPRTDSGTPELIFPMERAPSELTRPRSVFSSVSETKSLLDILLYERIESHPDGGAVWQRRLADEIEQIWSQRDRSVATALGAWAYRLMECVLQARNQPISKQIHKGLHNVPQELRGLCSFTGWQPQATETQRVEGESVNRRATGGSGDSVAHAEGSDFDNDHASNGVKYVNEVEAQDRGGDDDDVETDVHGIIDEEEAEGKVLGNEDKGNEPSEDKNLTWDEAHKVESGERGEEDSPQRMVSGGGLLASGEGGTENTEMDSRKEATGTENRGRNMADGGHISIDMLEDKSK